MNCLAFRCALLLLLSVLSGGASALGLGDLRGQPSLGEGLRLEVDILGEGKAALDASCFRLVAPSGGELPWLKKANFTLHRGKTVVLEIRSDIPLREPILQLAVQIGCGHEVVREYMLLASPAANPVASAVQVPLAKAVPDAARSLPRSYPARTKNTSERDVESAPTAWQRKPGWPRTAHSLPDRLLLSSSESEAEPSLRLATELTSLIGAGHEAKEAQREMLRLEFRMLLAMNEQATTQLETAEKLRNMEAMLGELQQRAGEFSQRVEQSAAPAEAIPEKAAATPSAPVDGAAGRSVSEPLQPEAASGLSEWSLYGALLGVFVGLGGWLAWRNFRERHVRHPDASLPPVVPEIEVDPERTVEREGRVDFPVEQMTASVSQAQVDFELDVPRAPVGEPVKAASPPMSGDSVLSMTATTVDEHFEANPVMELADIMLSFGRVKGAAQALQEYIDNNPQEALQPWIRLMDVYRMAGMRKEFEAVARNLNQNFNVEIQQWEAGQPMPNRHTLDLLLDETVEPVAPPLPATPKPESLEEMPRLLAMISELWPAGDDVVGYLYQLLRDNRGGQRIGFSLPVVEEILFLIELKETSSRMEKERIKS